MFSECLFAWAKSMNASRSAMAWEAGSIASFSSQLLVAVAPCAGSVRRLKDLRLPDSAYRAEDRERDAALNAFLRRHALAGSRGCRLGLRRGPRLRLLGGGDASFPRSHIPH